MKKEQVHIKARNLYICILLIFFSCKKEKEAIISGYLNGKYWDVMSVENRKFVHPKYCSYFGANNDYFYYVYRIDKNTNKKVRIKFDYGDVIYPDKWYLESDSVINIQSFRYRILRLSENTLKIQNIEVPSDITEYKLSVD